MLPAPDPTNPESMLAAFNNVTSILQFPLAVARQGSRPTVVPRACPDAVDMGSGRRIWGAQDGLVHPAYGKAFAAKINGAKLQVFDHAGHLPQLEQPKKVAVAVTAFLT